MIAMDLLAHAFGSYALSFTLAVGTGNPAAGFFTTMAVGVIKEHSFDEYPSSRDMSANFVGAAAGLAAYQIIERIRE
jgi:hypothetical protein